MRPLVTPITKGSPLPKSIPFPHGLRPIEPRAIRGRYEAPIAHMHQCLHFRQQGNVSPRCRNDVDQQANAGQQATRRAQRIGEPDRRAGLEIMTRENRPPDETRQSTTIILSQALVVIVNGR